MMKSFFAILLLGICSFYKAFALIGGDDATKLQVASMSPVAFYLDQELFCGGTLIASSTVISAKHCFKTIQDKSITVKIAQYEINLVLDRHALKLHPTVDLALVSLPTELLNIKPINWRGTSTNPIWATGFGHQSLMLIDNEWVLGTKGEFKIGHIKNIHRDNESYYWFSHFFLGVTPSLCLADSGSGLISQSQDGQYQLLAVNSQIEIKAQEGEGFSRAIRIDIPQIQSWISRGL